MKFRTELELSKSDIEIKHSSSVLILGSCFSENMAHRLQQNKFPVSCNPFGILFTPKAIENALERIYSHTLYERSEIASYKDRYFSWDHHSSYSGLDPEKVLKKINQQICESNELLPGHKVVFVTLGTAWVYELKKAQVMVANCHKVPGDNFTKVLLTDVEIKNSLRNICQILFDANPEVKIVFTVSPVRHLKDGMVANNLSKSKLITAVHDMVAHFEQVSYFPSYELLVDDLRDYRFYAEDLLHPNSQALDYVWSKFSTVYFNEETQGWNQVIRKIQKSVQHRAFNPNSIAHKKFIHVTLREIERVKRELKPASFSEEIAQLKAQLE